MTITVKFQLLDYQATLPSVPAPGDVGFDISSCESILIHPQRVAVVRTGLAYGGLAAFSLSDGAIGRIFPKIEGRSGLASQGIFPIGGIIDPTYRGEIKVVLANLNDTTYTVKPGDRIAQLVFYTALITWYHELINIEEVTTTEETSRGSNGFGSTGI